MGEPNTVIARDSLAKVSDDSDAAVRALRRIVWSPAEFKIELVATPDADHDAELRFPSPKPSGNARQDRVVARWYRALDAEGKPLAGPQPAVVIVHSLHPQLVIGQSLARAFARSGRHGFIVEMPGYQSRRDGPWQPTGTVALKHAPQTVADVRRTFDAVAALPAVDATKIHLQGSSMGGMVAAVVGSIDPCFASVQLVVCGSGGLAVLQQGGKDAFHLNRALEQMGYRGIRLEALINPIEPAKLAHRLDPETTWLFFARNDMVFPRFTSEALAKTIGLADDHFVQVEGNHYTMFLVMPAVVHQMVQNMKRVEASVARGAEAIDE